MSTATAVPASGPALAPAAPSVADGNLQRTWKSLVDGLLKTNASCGSLLLNATATADDGSELTVTLPGGSSFTRRMLERADVKEIVDAAVAAAFGPRKVVYVEPGSPARQPSASAKPVLAAAPASTPAAKPAPAPSVAPASAQAQEPGLAQAPDPASHDKLRNLHQHSGEIPETSGQSAEFAAGEGSKPASAGASPAPVAPVPAPAPVSAPAPEPVPTAPAPAPTAPAPTPQTPSDDEPPYDEVPYDDADVYIPDDEMAGSGEPPVSAAPPVTPLSSMPVPARAASLQIPPAARAHARDTAAAAHALSPDTAPTPVDEDAPDADNPAVADNAATAVSPAAADAATGDSAEAGELLDNPDELASALSDIFGKTKVTVVDDDGNPVG